MLFGCDFDQGWSIEKGCNGFVSDAPRPSKSATPDFHVLAIWLVEVVTTSMLIFFLLALHSGSPSLELVGHSG